MRLGILGGSFDPVHYGHLILAEQCREACRLDRVWFVPAAQPPHKQKQRLATPQQRLEMLQLAIAGHDAFEISRYEVDRGGVNYTFETLAAIQAQQPEAELFFLMGGDSLADLPQWREPARICEQAVLVVAQRTGSPPPAWSQLQGFASPARLERFAEYKVEMPQVEISSSDIRGRVAAGRSIRYLTPRSVEMYIRTQNLYST